MDPPKIGDLPNLIKSNEKETLKVLNAMVQNGELIKLSSEIFILREEFEKTKTKITEFGKTHPQFRASDIRDLLNSSRKLIIPLLEYFDKIGITLRKGDFRSLRTK